MGRVATGRRATARLAAGLSLLELLLSLGLGLLLAGVVTQLLLAGGDQGLQLTRLLRERTWQRRSLALIRADLRRASALELGSGDGSACPLAGRRPVLQLRTAGGVITYAVGAPPSPIWRGQVLLRCGPAFGLYGEPSTGAPQNRVLVDALPPQGLSAERLERGRLRLQLEQRLPLAGGGQQTIATTLELAAPAPLPSPPSH